jgi:tyrosyl-tRNA synthetase
VGREIQREYGQTSQVALTMPILVGLDGERKMSKSLGNYIGITEAPSEMFGKVMSISDELMWSYYDLLTDFTEPVIVRLREEVRTGVLHPMEAKMQLAHTIVAGFHGEEAARQAGDKFQREVRDGKPPEVATQIDASREWQQNFLPPGTTRVPLAKLIAMWKLVGSRTEAEKLIRQGAVEWNGERVQDPAFQVDLAKVDSANLRVGKRIYRSVVFK